MSQSDNEPQQHCLAGRRRRMRPADDGDVAGSSAISTTRINTERCAESFPARLKSGDGPSTVA